MEYEVRDARTTSYQAKPFHELGELPTAVQEFYQLHLEGNVIPHVWYQTITYEVNVNAGGKKATSIESRPYLEAILILADLIYWHKPSVERDETTNKVVGYRKKFSGQRLRRSYEQIAEHFNFSVKVARQAVDYLVDQGLVEREYCRENNKGVHISSMCLTPIPEGVKRVTFPGLEGGEESPDGKSDFTKRSHDCDRLVKQELPFGQSPYIVKEITKEITKEAGPLNVANAPFNGGAPQKIADSSLSTSAPPQEIDEAKKEKRAAGFQRKKDVDALAVAYYNAMSERWRAKGRDLAPFAVTTQKQRGQLDTFRKAFGGQPIVVVAAKLADIVRRWDDFKCLAWMDKRGNGGRGEPDVGRIVAHLVDVLAEASPPGQKGKWADADEQTIYGEEMVE